MSYLALTTVLKSSFRKKLASEEMSANLKCPDDLSKSSDHWYKVSRSLENMGCYQLPLVKRDFFQKI